MLNGCTGPTAIFFVNLGTERAPGDYIAIRKSSLVRTAFGVKQNRARMAALCFGNELLEVDVSAIQGGAIHALNAPAGVFFNRYAEIVEAIPPGERMTADQIVGAMNKAFLPDSLAHRFAVGDEAVRLLLQQSDLHKQVNIKTAILARARNEARDALVQELETISARIDSLTLAVQALRVRLVAP